jgi:putative phosphoribosyl transferase
MAEDLPFMNRTDAGRRLAAALTRFKRDEPIILALPRGGVPVAFEVARILDAPLDVALVRELGAPDHPELGIGAIVDGNNPQVVLNDDVMEMLRPTAHYMAVEQAEQLQELERRRKLYRNDRPPPSLEGRTIILVDDGIATGGTVKAVLRGLSRAKAKRVILAIPVAPADTLRMLESEADEIVCLATPEPFYGVGAHYRDFTQTTDAEVITLLREADLFQAPSLNADRRGKEMPSHSQRH